MTPSAPPRSHSEIFYEVFPFYLSIGMTEEQYWNGDNSLVIAYRKAYEIMQERRNQELWLQGAYIYEALLDVAPILQAFAKKGTKARPYSSEPYTVTAKQAEMKEEAKARQVHDKGLQRMQQFMASMSAQSTKKTP